LNPVISFFEVFESRAAREPRRRRKERGGVVLARGALEFLGTILLFVVFGFGFVEL